MPPVISAPVLLKHSPFYAYYSPPVPTRLEACEKKLTAIHNSKKLSGLSVTESSFTAEQAGEIYGTLRQYQERLIELKKRDPETIVQELKWVTLGVSAVIRATMEYILTATIADLCSERTWPTLLLSCLTALMAAGSYRMELRDRGPQPIAQNFKLGTLVRAVKAGSIMYTLTAAVVSQFSERTWIALLLSGLMGIKSAPYGTRLLNEVIFALMQFGSDVPSGQLGIVNIKSGLKELEERLETALQNSRETAFSSAVPASHSYTHTNSTNIINRSNKYEAQIRPLLQSADEILELLRPAPIWEQFPDGLVAYLVSSARELAKIEGVIINHLLIVCAVRLITPYFLMSEYSAHKNEVNMAVRLFNGTLNEALGLFDAALVLAIGIFVIVPCIATLNIKRNCWWSLGNIVENLVSTLKSENAAAGSRR